MGLPQWLLLQNPATQIPLGHNNLKSREFQTPSQAGGVETLEEMWCNIVSRLLFFTWEIF